MSLRQIAKELGISPAYLSYMLNGKRPWRKDLYQRYMGFVNTFVNSDVVGVETQLEVGEGISPSQEEKSMERAMGFEPTTSCLGSKHSTPELRPLGAKIIATRYHAVTVVGFGHSKSWFAGLLRVAVNRSRLHCDRITSKPARRLKTHPPNKLRSIEHCGLKGCN